MTRRFAGAAVLGAALLVCIPVRAAVDDGDEPASSFAFPDAEELLRGVTDGLPGIPIRIEAKILARSREGELERTLAAVMDLDWHGAAPKARYEIRDAFGAPLEALEVRWRGPAVQELAYQRGDPLETAPAPALDQPIQETDLSWIDLSLAYLWWPGGTTVGAEKIKGRFCYIVDLPAPPGHAGSYAGVRLWIDPQIRILLEAAAYDAEGRMLKLLEVKSFKKIGDVWVIQNIDVQSFPAKHRTSLRVGNAQALDGNAPPDKPDGG